MLTTLRELAAISPDGHVDEEELINEVVKKGIKAKKARELLVILHEEGSMLMLNGRYRPA